MNVQIEILWQDNDVMLINKPAGIACLPLAGSSLPSIAESLSQQMPELQQIPESGLAHRLDNDTSGCLLVAKHEAAYHFYRKAFQEQRVQKIYQALVLGHTPEHGEINAPIAHHPRKAHKMLACATEGKAEANKARPALTYFRTLKQFEEYSFLEVEIVTGMRHQIRVHLAFLGHPIVGDTLYQKPTEREVDQLGLTRPFLHAIQLSFPLFEQNTAKTVACPLSPDLQQVLSKRAPR